MTPDFSMKGQFMSSVFKLFFFFFFFYGVRGGNLFEI